jgi:hypothetical protein
VSQVSVKLRASPIKKRQRHSKKDADSVSVSQRVSEIIKHDVHNTYADFGTKPEESVRLAILTNCMSRR